MILGNAWSTLLAPTGLSVAVRLNLFAGVCSALATGFLFLVTHRVVAGWMVCDGASGGGRGAMDVNARGVDRAGARNQASRAGASSALPLVAAWAGAMLGATAYTVWNQSNVSEKVYPLSLLVIAAVSWIAVVWMDRKDRPGSGWMLVLALYLMVLGSTSHLMSLLPAPALLALVVVAKPRILMDRAVLVHGMCAVLLGLSLNLFLPIRAAERPIISEGEPTCESVAAAAAAVYSMGRAGCPALVATLTREQYGKRSIFEDPTSDVFAPEPRGAGLLAHQVLNYFQYFDWQWARGLAASELPGNRRLPVSLLFLGLGIWGLRVAGRSQRGHATYLGVLAATLSIGLVGYLNFEYGYSLGPEGVEREVRERDYFFLASFHLHGFLAGMGLVAAWRWLAGGRPTRRTLAAASPVLGLALVPLVFNWGWADRAGDHSARDFAYDLLQSVEPYGVLFTGGDHDAFPLWYLQEVEGVRQDVTVVVSEYLSTDWYPRQLQYHTAPERQRPFRDEEGLGLYDAQRPPTRPVITRAAESLDGAGPVILSDSLPVRLGPRVFEYPAGHRFTRRTQIALAMIQDSIGERPVHFASTGAMARELGLEEWTVKQGLASKLRVDVPQPEAGVVRTAAELGGDWIDFERSLLLADEVFRYRGLRDREIWPDMPSANIPLQLYFLHMQLADAALRRGEDEQLAERLVTEADRFLVTAMGGSRARRGS